MKRSIVALATALALPVLPTLAHADLAFNVGAFTDYRFRGISQTRLKPAVQGGVDYSQGGFYAGAWASNIKWTKDLGGDGDVELDLYAGLAGELQPGVGYDVGVLTYVYPGNDLDPSANTTEIYGSLSYAMFKLKYSHAVTDTFANPDSKNSYYLDLSASFELTDGWSLAPHIGRQRIRGPVGGDASYWDYALTLSKDFDGFQPSLSVVGTSDINRDFYTAKGKYLGKSALVLGVKYVF
jgi:uncharacterized protein (TIGR02001 family)